MSHPASISEASVSDSVKQLSCLTSCQRSCEQQLKQELVLLLHPAAAPKAAASFPQQQGQSMSVEQQTCVLGQLVPGDSPSAPVPQVTQLASTQPTHRLVEKFWSALCTTQRNPIPKALNTAEVAVRCWVSHFPSFLSFSTTEILLWQKYRGRIQKTISLSKSQPQ